jgi:hypothetical protein
MWKPNRIRQRGRSRQRWNNRVKEDLKFQGIRNGERLLLYREPW